MVLTKEKLESMSSGEIIAVGIAPNAPDGLFMTSSHIGRKLLWVAKRGDDFPDWAIYCSFLDGGHNFIPCDSEGRVSITGVMQLGEKVVSKNTVKLLVPCDTAALDMYRI